jgi:HSF-type DNA-binding
VGASSVAAAAAQQQHESAKTRPKRRRKPQKPGKTAKLNDRHFVVHNYHDHSHDPDDADDEDQSSSYEDHHHHSSSFEHGDEGRRRGGVAVAFPLKLHAVLDQVERDGYSHVISWSPHGRCFVIHKPKQFTEEVMPKYVWISVFCCPQIVESPFTAVANPPTTRFVLRNSGTSASPSSLPSSDN